MSYYMLMKTYLTVPLESELIGVHVDVEGKRWNAYRPTGFAQSAWVRLEPVDGVGKPLLRHAPMDVGLKLEPETK